MSRTILGISVGVALWALSVGSAAQAQCLSLSVGVGGVGDATPRRLPIGDPINDALLREAAYFRQTLRVEAPLYYYMEDGIPNAYARPRGPVVLGTLLLRKCQSDDGQYFMLSLGYVMAHEYGHQFQFRMTRNQVDQSPVTELQADILAGYWAGQRLVSQGFGGVEAPRSVILRKAKNIGDYVFGHPNHHGTPDQRERATQAGFDAGEEAKFGNLAASFGRKAQELYDWSRAEAEAIYRRR